MLDYYERRLPEYEAIYAKPERQADLQKLEARILELVSDRAVVELACGTGYWSRRIASAARSLHVTDASEKLARQALSSCKSQNVSMGVMDAFSLPPCKTYDSMVAGFFWSHVAMEELQPFLNGLQQAFAPGTRMVFFDNRFVAGSSTPISRRSQSGDTYQMRQLADGSQHEVLKNFPSGKDLKASLEHTLETVEIYETAYYWLAHGDLCD